MAKKITIYVPDELSLYTGREIVQLAKKGLSDTVDVSVPLSSSDGISRSDDIILTMLEKIYGKIDNVYDDTQKIVGEIEKKKVKSDTNQSQDMTMSMVWGDKWRKFKECRDRGGSMGYSGWEDFADLVLRTPFNMIQKNIDEGKYILD